MHDRLGAHRNDHDWLDARWSSDSSRMVLISGTRMQMPGGAMQWQTTQGAPAGLRVLLGELDGLTYWALIIDPAEAPGAREEWVDPRTAMMGFVMSGAPMSQVALGFQAVGLAEWHWSTKKCSRCGATLDARAAGYELVCPDCSKVFFPRTDPAVIMAVAHGEPGSHEERCLLGRPPAWPEGRFSTLAGFVEPGESLADAVRREVWEETGIRVGEVRYFDSQPWPFPQSLMLGFLARAETDDITVDGVEISEARWVTREQMHREANEGTLRLPPSVSISRMLLQEWYGEELPGHW